MTENSEIVKSENIGQPDLNSPEKIIITTDSTIPSAPLIKPKRSLSKLQLEALKRGREKLTQKKSGRNEPMIKNEFAPVPEVKMQKHFKSSPTDDLKEKRIYRKRVRTESKEAEEPLSVSEEKPTPVTERHTEPVRETKSDNQGIIVLALIGMVAVVGFFLLRFFNGQRQAPQEAITDEGPNYSIGQSFQQTTSSGAYPIRVDADGNPVG